MAAREHRKTHAVEQTEKMIPLITGEMTFRLRSSDPWLSWSEQTDREGFEGIQDNMKGKRGSGRGKGLGVGIMAATFTVSVKSEVEFVHSAAKRNEYNPFDVCSPFEKLCQKQTSLSDWKQWCRHLVEILLSVLHGNILKNLRKSHQFPNLDDDEFELVDCDDERSALNDRLVPSPDATPRQIIKNIKEARCARKSKLRHIPQSAATALPTICDIFGVATDAGRVVVDSGATETVGSPEALRFSRSRKSCLTQRWKSMWKQDEQRLWNLLMERWLSRMDANISRMIQYLCHRINRCTTVVESSALQVTIDFTTNTMTYWCSVRVESFEVDRACDEPEGTLSRDPSETKTGRRFWQSQTQSMTTEVSPWTRNSADLDNCNNQTSWKLSKSFHLLIHQNLSKIPPLTTDNAQLEHVNQTQTTSAPVQCQSENGSGNVICESCPVEQRVGGSTNRLQTQAMTVSGKAFVRTETLQSTQRDKEMRSSWFWTFGRRRGSQESIERQLNVRTFWKISFHQSQTRIDQTWTDVSDSRAACRVLPDTSSKTENTTEKWKRRYMWHRKTQFITTLTTWSSKVRRHHSGRDE